MQLFHLVVSSSIIDKDTRTTSSCISLIQLNLPVLALADVFFVVDWQWDCSIVTFTLLFLDTSAGSVSLVSILTGTGVVAWHIFIFDQQAEARFLVVDVSTCLVTSDIVVVALPFLVVIVTDFYKTFSIILFHWHDNSFLYQNWYMQLLGCSDQNLKGRPLLLLLVCYQATDQSFLPRSLIFC